MRGHARIIKLNVRGWVSDCDEPGLRLTVTCSVDDQWRGTVDANELRPDVQSAGFGDGFCGFSFAIPTIFGDGRVHTVGLELAGHRSFQFPGFPLATVFQVPDARIAVGAASDAPAFAAFWQAHLRHDATSLPAAERKALVAQNVAALSPATGHLVLLAWVHAQVVGYCLLERKAYGAYRHAAVLRMAILKPFRRHQLGSRLVKAAIEHARRSGIRRLELTVIAQNLPARQLYDKHGFQLEGTLRENHFNGTGFSDELMMSRLETAQ